MSVGEWLANTLSPDQGVREEATKNLESAYKENYAQYMLLLSQELSNESSPSHVRSAAGIALKNSLVGGAQEVREHNAQQWLNTDATIKIQIKMAVLQALSTPDTHAGNQAAQAVAAVAQIDLPPGLWPDLIVTLLKNVTSSPEANLKRNTLMTIGFICESVPHEVLAAHSDTILTAVINGARKEEMDMGVRYQAIKALYNSLDFIRNNFENREGERNFIMQVVCEATQSKNVEIEVAAFECLSKIMQNYYDMMALYMEKALFGLTVFGMQNENERVALQAVEFWSTVCDIEIQRTEDNEDALELQAQPQVIHNFAGVAVKDLIPVLTVLLTKQTEDADEDEWTISMAAGTCISLLAQCVKDAIVPHALPFIEQNLKSAAWQARDAAVMTFGSILEGPKAEILAPLVQQALPYLIELMRDPTPQVKDTTAWTLGRVCEYVLGNISLENLPFMVSSLVVGLQDSSRIATNCCWSLMNLGEQLDGSQDISSDLSPFYESIITALLKVSARDDNEGNVRSASYQALSTMLSVAPEDCLPWVEKATSEILNRLEATVQQQSQLLGADDKSRHAEHQANICSVLTSSIRRVGDKIAAVADQVMHALLSVLQSAGKQSTVLEDAFLAIGALCTSVEGNFLRYMDSFKPFLASALQNHEEHQLCSIAVGLVSDVCRSLNEQAAPYCDEFMQLLIHNLQSPVLHRDVKPAILGCFGDVALAIGGNFHPYLDGVLNVLAQAGQMRYDPATAPEDMYDYVLDLREGIIEAWIGIVQALKAEHKVQLIQSQLVIMFTVMQEVSMEPSPGDSLSRGVAGLLGDLADSEKELQIRDYLLQPWVDDFLSRIVRTRSNLTSTRKIAKWARDLIKSTK